MSSSSGPRPLVEPAPSGDARLDALARVLAIVDRLRAPVDGCPWDREQTVVSMSPSLIEEAHEAVESIDRAQERGTVEELGDLFMVIALIAKIAEQEQRFDLAQIGNAVAEKLIRRHPHVFGEVVVGSSTQALANWEKIKEGERKDAHKDASALAGVPVALPALQRASRVAAKSISAGFKWADVSGALAKLREEMGEFEEAYAQRERAPERVEEELGDVLLAAAFLGHYLGFDPEKAARGSLRRFEQRFRRMEGEVGERLRSAPLPELLAAWERAKAATAEAR
ncbi:MAG: nucleoside triphosphate pyrophosphohydrolase [Planctomycetes bacterium]|nr:nucleoside triphosphate pyrophosphohydrolase [Planctomycetota bacterium]